jgi:tripartite-type tricarboxylate transporter receptor subunit TctC
MTCLLQALRPSRVAAIGILATLYLTIAVATSWSQAGRTIKVIISVPPGGAIDLLVRVLADYIGRTNGQTLIIESRPGAGSAIAAEAAARATPDGSTLLVNVNGMLINSILRKVNFDPLGFEPICLLVNSPQVLAVNATSSYRTLGDLITAARQKPGELAVATVGPNTTQHLAIGRLMRRAGINMTYVPYPGGAPAINALLGGHVTAVLQNYSEIGPQLNAGALRALATPSAKRIEPLPDVPTIAEQGFSGFEAEVWFGLVAPPKTPHDAIAQLIDWFSAALQADEVRTKLAAQALYPQMKCGADFAAHIRHQFEEYVGAIRDLQLRGG